MTSPHIANDLNILYKLFLSNCHEKYGVVVPDGTIAV